MEFNFINISGLAIVIIMLIPNLIYAKRAHGVHNKCKSRFFNIIEQIGRYSSFILMFLPLGVREFGFYDILPMLTYLFANSALLIAYLIIWGFYFKKPSVRKALALAVIPTAIFLISGLTLRHWLLVAAALLFGTGHIYVTYQNHK